MIKLAFLGTSDKSAPILNKIKKFTQEGQEYKLALCVTKKDTLVGRKKSLRQTEVKKWAVQNDTPVIEISSLKGSDLVSILTEIKNTDIELAIVADFSFIIPEKLLLTTSKGFLNIHFSLLPKYRGASPVQHAIINNEKETGISYQMIDAGMDTGALVMQTKHDINIQNTTESLQRGLFEQAANEICEVIHLACTTEPANFTAQNHADATYCYSPTHPKSTLVYKEDAKIDWTEPPQQIERKIRAFYTWPIAHTTLSELDQQGYLKIKPSMQGKKHLSVKIYDAEICQNDNELKIKTLQIEGKNKTSFEDFLRGYSF